MFSYYIHWVAFESSNSKVVVEKRNYYVDAATIQDALTEFWDYVSPYDSLYYIEITYMAKEILPDTYENPKFKFCGGKK